MKETRAGGALNAVGVCSEVAALIRERYPQDRATGYAEGDLRGAVSVSVV
jgi:hypothetical protein